MLNNYYYDKLTTQEQFSYNTIRTALVNKNSQYVVYDLDEVTLEKIWKAVVFENPDIISYPGLVCSHSRQRNTITGLFEYSSIDYDLYEKKFNNLIQKINAKLKATSSDYYVCKVIYDLLTTTIFYQTKVLRDYLKLKNETYHNNRNSSDLASFLDANCMSFTPYGVVVNSKGVCQGIAKLYKILCNRFGIECACVEAKTKDSPNMPFPIIC